MAKRSNIMDDNYVVNYGLVEETLTEDIGNKEKAAEIVKDCKAKEPTNKEDISLALYKCIVAGKINA